MYNVHKPKIYGNRACAEEATPLQTAMRGCLAGDSVLHLGPPWKNEAIS